LNNDDPTYLREAEIALIDTLKLVFEIIVAKGISEPEILSEALLRQAKQYPPQDIAGSETGIDTIAAVHSQCRLMEWSGRAPAPPAIEAGKGRQRQGARHVS
jgi:hypothetical protein